MPSQGVAQAFEDAHALALALRPLAQLAPAGGEPTAPAAAQLEARAKAWEEALRAYEAARADRAARMQRISRVQVRAFRDRGASLFSAWLAWLAGEGRLRQHCIVFLIFKQRPRFLSIAVDRVRAQAQEAYTPKGDLVLRLAFARAEAEAAAATDSAIGVDRATKVNGDSSGSIASSGSRSTSDEAGGSSSQPDSKAAVRVGSEGTVAEIEAFINGVRFESLRPAAADGPAS